jgi:hypothetical protein
MKCVERIRDLVEGIGGELVEENGTLLVYSPAGYFWDATGSRLIAKLASDFRTGQQWFREATAELEESIREGCSLCSEQESEEMEWDTGEQWKAVAGSPEEIRFN